MISYIIPAAVDVLVVAIRFVAPPRIMVPKHVVLNSDEMFFSSKNTRLFVLAMNINSASTYIGGAPNNNGTTLKEHTVDSVVVGAKVKFALLSEKVDVVFKNKNDGSLTTVAAQDSVLTMAMVGMLSPPTPSIKCVVASHVRVIVPENVDVVDAVVGEIVFCGLVAVSESFNAVPKTSVI